MYRTNQSDVRTIGHIDTGKSSLGRQASQFANVGTSATDLDLVLADGTVDPINITGTSNSATTFRDGDTDTFIRVESSNSDNDEIEMHTAGVERVKVNATAADFSVPVKLPNLTTTQRDALSPIHESAQGHHRKEYPR